MSRSHSITGIRIRDNVRYFWDHIFTVGPEDQEQVPYPITQRYMDENYYTNEIPFRPNFPTSYLSTDLRGYKVDPEKPKRGKRRQDMHVYMMAVGVVVSLMVFWLKQMIFGYRHHFN